MPTRSRPVSEAAWGPTEPLPSPQKTLERLTKLAVRAGKKKTRERAAGKTR